MLGLTMSLGLTVVTRNVRHFQPRESPSLTLPLDLWPEQLM